MEMYLHMDYIIKLMIVRYKLRINWGYSNDQESGWKYKR